MYIGTRRFWDHENGSDLAFSDDILLKFVYKYVMAADKVKWSLSETFLKSLLLKNSFYVLLTFYLE